MLQKWVHFSGLNAFVHGLSVVLAFCLITLLHVILGEIVPKSIAIVQAERMVLWVARPLHAFWLLSYPIVNLFDFLAKLVLKLVGIEPQRDSAHSEEEIKIIVGESLKGGVIDYVEEELIKNAVDFSDTSAREIMTPRNDMVCLDTKQSHEQHLQTILKHPFTRYPCCEGHKDNILGVVHIKDILSTPILERKEPDLKRLLQEVLIVPESASISQILIKMNQQKMRMALVVDEYGGTSGVLTMDDIFEEIMGNIFEGQNENKEGIKRLMNTALSAMGGWI